MSKSSSLPAEPFDTSSSEAASPAWKQEVNQRLAAHRTRRGVNPESADPAAAENPRQSNARAAQAAARVAARYAKAPSYSEVLAGEARAVVRAAGAAAHAALSAQAAAEAVLANLESGPLAQSEWAAPSLPAPPAAPVTPSRWQDEPPAQAAITPEPLVKPRWEETLPELAPPQATVESTERDVWAEMRVHPHPGQAPTRPSANARRRDERELFPFDSNEAMGAYDPIAGATVEPAQPIPANLIQFPRELVAAKKARPRLAEGPYRSAQDSPQLSIFEVDPDLLDPPVVLHAPPSQAIAPPEWASIELDHHPEPAYSDPAPIYNQTSYTSQPYAASTYAEPEFDQPAYADLEYAPADYADQHYSDHDYATPTGVAVSSTSYTPLDYYPSASSAAQAPAVESPTPLPETLNESLAEPRAQASSVELLVASVADRALASVVDLSVVTLAVVAAAFVAMFSMDHLPGVRVALIASAVAMVLFGLLYQYLFLSFAEEGTPGMRYARIALCTFDDENPTRSQMRMRIPAMILSTLPLGIGLAWALMDKEHVGWHDRWTKTYQRKY